MLGENCPYDHGTDPLVVGTMLPWHPPGGNSTNMAAMSQLRAIGMCICMFHCVVLNTYVVKQNLQ